mgnify:CR=1 FL=1
MDRSSDDNNNKGGRLIPVLEGNEDANSDDSLKLPENPELAKALEDALASIDQKNRQAKEARERGAEMSQKERESLQGRIKELHLKLMEKERELEEKSKLIEEYKNMAARRQADLENYRKRVQKERADMFNYGNEEIAREFLEVLDNLERALNKGKDEPASILGGVELTKKLMEQIFRKFGVEPIEVIGKSFDPNYHEAVAQIPSPGKEPGTVIHEEQKGYMLKDRLLRPSRVIVSAGEPENNSVSEE